MSRSSTSFSRYLPTNQQAKKWGWRLLDAGRQTVSPGEAYPREGHPMNYLFDRNGYRIINEYQVVYLIAGRGHFRSRSIESTPLHAGDALLLYPGEEHHYHPDPQTGWTEVWVGFRGKEADRIMESFFDRRHPVIQVAQREAMVDHFDRLLGWLERTDPSKQQILASHVPLTLALLGPGVQGSHRTAGKDAELVARAKESLLVKLDEKTDLHALARSLGVSYSRFRFAFKEQTGFAPREFENYLKLNRARDLLRHDGTSVSETAHMLGYSNVYYFSTAFKKRFGLSPMKWLERVSGASTPAMAQSREGGSKPGPDAGDA